MRAICSAGLVGLCLSGVFASPAGAANRIEGVWSYGRGLVEITPAGVEGGFKGVIIRRLKFSYCPHRRGERMWQILDLLDGTYRGRHLNYFRDNCEPDPGAPSLWRVRKVGRRDVLDFCANDPGSEEPKDFSGAGCDVLKRVAPARDLARVCSSGTVRVSRAGRDVCMDGPTELRRTGCVRRQRSARHRFEVKLKRKSGGRRLVDARTRIRAVRFRLDGMSRAKDGRAPFRIALKGSRLSAGPHTLVADVQLYAPRSKTSKRRKLTFKFEACR